MPKATCSVADCDRLAQSRGWCRSHYMRWYMHRETPEGPIKPWGRGRICSVDGCENKHAARGLCAPHVKRVNTHGDPGSAEIKPRSMRDDQITYALIHNRLKLRRGSAKRRSCTLCGTRAQQWAYDHEDANERVDPELGYAFSVDLDHYVPMCVRCHKNFDMARINGTPQDLISLGSE